MLLKTPKAQKGLLEETADRARWIHRMHHSGPSFGSAAELTLSPFVSGPLHYLRCMNIHVHRRHFYPLLYALTNLDDK
jgi:hypothetical protein